MNREQLAVKINGHKYTENFDEDLLNEAKENGLVIVYGYSDDLIEFEGALYEEVDNYRGGPVFILKVRKGFSVINKGKLKDLNETLDHLDLDIKIPIVKIKTKFTDHWEITTDLPHSNFAITDDGRVQCRGIVLDINDIERSITMLSNEA